MNRRNSLRTPGSPITRGWFAAVVAGACVLVSAAACEGESAGGGEPPLVMLPPIRTAADIVLPLDAYSDTGEDRTQSWTAVQIIGRECMRRYGLDWPILPLGPQQTEEMRNVRRYGIFNEEEARQYGYTLPPRYTSDGGQPPPDMPKITNAQSDVWTGEGRKAGPGETPIPPGGCVGEASLVLSKGKKPPSRDDVQKLSHEAYGKSKNDSRFKAAKEQWTSCMQARGYQYKDIWDGNNTNWGKTPEGGITDAEINSATADVQCGKESNLTNIWFAVETAYQNRIIEENSETLKDTKEYYETVKRETSAFLATAAPTP